MTAERRFSLALWVAMLFSIAMYFVVIRMARPVQAVDSPALVRSLLILSAVCAGFSFVVKKWFEARAADDNKPALRRVGFLIALVLCEAAALYGVVAWFLTATPQYYIFLTIGFAAILLHYPTQPD